MNAAKRILTVVEAVIADGANSNTASESHWARILLGTSGAANFDHVKLVRRLDSVITQLEITEDLLAEAGVPDETYAAGFAQLKRGLSPARLTEAWGSVKQSFTADIPAALRWAAWVIKDDESPASEEDLDAIRNEVTELRSLLSTNSVPASLRALIRRQLDDMEVALDLYQISGAQGVEKALNAALGQITMHQDDIRAASASASAEQKVGIEKFTAFIGKVAGFVDRTAKTAKSADTLVTYYQATEKLLLSSPTIAG